MILAMIWMNLENIKVHEEIVMNGQILYDSILCEMPTKTENRLAFTYSWIIGWRKEEIRGKL